MTLRAMTEARWYDEVLLPALLRAAWNTYTRAVRSALGEAELDDLPRNGPFVLGGLAQGSGSLTELTQRLGVTKQAASQLVDTLVTRGYLHRGPDPDDRRRMRIELTDRGRFAAAQVRRAVESVDAELAGRLPEREFAALRAGLGVLAEVGSGGQPRVGTPLSPADRARPDPGPPAGPPGPDLGPSAGPPGPDLGPSAGRPDPNHAPALGSDLASKTSPGRPAARLVPIFPVRDLARALAHYTSLGFQVSSYQDGDEYGFAERDGAALHLSHQVDLDPAVGASAAYLYVADADALAREWARPRVGGRTRAPRDTSYGLREGAHVDPDNNLIRFASPMRTETEADARA
jgi:DNA-binding MarR family transcriptional regulator